jgi:hypothetical protein
MPMFRNHFLKVLVLGFFLITTLSFAQAAPACVTSLPGIRAIPADKNQYVYTHPTLGEVFIFISNKRYQVGPTSGGARGTWSCDAAGKFVLTPDVAATGGQPGATTPGVGGQPGATNTGGSTPLSEFPLKVKLDNPLKVNTIKDAIGVFMDAVVKIAIPFIVVFFIWSGISFILAQGKPEDIKKAKNMFWYTVIGTLLILGAWAITDAIIGTINSIAS